MTAGGVVRVVDDLVTLLIASDTGDPAFMRVAAVHWPAELDVIRTHHRPARGGGLSGGVALYRHGTRGGRCSSTHRFRSRRSRPVPPSSTHCTRSSPP